ncbi:malonyl-CoA decarboxylase family protein, partial [Luminiphilus sp.]|nr:malonyl-CoA decarboxylase family protein [Luminiphilus sp.]
HVERQIDVIPDLSECPPGKDASWLCRWCQSMHCTHRQDQLLVRYSRVLELRVIDWNSPAAVLEKIIEYESVHAIQGWEDVCSVDKEWYFECYSAFINRYF